MFRRWLGSGGLRVERLRGQASVLKQTKVSFLVNHTSRIRY